MSTSLPSALSENEREYFNKHDIMFYLEDAATQLLRIGRREINRGQALQFFADYFSDVVNRRHVAFRGFAYVNGTAYNRRSFLRLCWTFLKPLVANTDMLSIADYFTTINLLCEDFPIALVRRAAKLVVVEDALDCLLPFQDFFPAFQLQFYGQEFIQLCDAVFEECKRQQGGAVPVPSSAFLEQMAAATAAARSKRARSSKKRSGGENFLVPDSESLRTALASHPTLQNSDELLLRLSQSESIHEAIGGIPLRKIKSDEAA